MSELYKRTMYFLYTYLQYIKKQYAYWKLATALLEVANGYHAISAIDVVVAEVARKPRLEGKHREVSLGVSSLVQPNRHTRYTCGWDKTL